MPRGIGARLLAAALAPLLALVHAASAASGTAFYYASDPPWNELAAFDRVVVDPDHAGTPPRMTAERTKVIAYLAVGEAHPDRGWLAAVPAAWRIGTNPDWGSVVLDQTPEAWPRFLVERVVLPLWDAGYRGFFLDTLDSWRLVAKTDDEAAAQRAGLVRVIKAIRAALPAAEIHLNRGFEILGEVHAEVASVAAESLHRGWDPRQKRYRAVDEADRRALLEALDDVRAKWRLPVVVIDYVGPEERALARETAARIRANGFIPWVSTPAMDALGIGEIEVMPRRVLMIHDTGKRGEAIEGAQVARLGTLPLNHLGYVPEYRDVLLDAMPDLPLAGRYAGIVLWLEANDDRYAAPLAPLVARAMREGVKVAVLGRFGVSPGAQTDAIFGTSSRPADEPSRLVTIVHDARVGFEVPPLASRRDFFALASRDAEAWLRYANERDETMDAVAITPWGGYALAPYDVVALPGGRGARWVVDPIAFLARALALPVMPVPDVTTENGRRLLVVQADAEGWRDPTDLAIEERGAGRRAPAARRVVPASERLLHDVLERYRVPTTLASDAPAGPTTSDEHLRAAMALAHVERADRATLPESREHPVASTRANPSLTAVPPHGLLRRMAGETFAVLAPNPSEAAYTNGWTGPFNGYARAVETFALTDAPRRLTPFHIRFHAYAMTRRASVAALHEVYAQVLAARPHPVFASEYVAKVRDFERMVVARAPGGWLVRGEGALRQLRIPGEAGFPDLVASRGIAGFERAGDQTYLHATGSDTFVRMGDRVPEVGHIANTNARVIAFTRSETGFTAELTSTVPLAVELENADGCNVRFYGTGTPTAIHRGRRTTHESGDPHGGRATVVCRG